MSDNDQRLWSAAEIANFIGVSEKTVCNHIISSKAMQKNGFPYPRIIPSSGTRGIKRWKPDEVIRWVEKCKPTH